MTDPTDACSVGASWLIILMLWLILTTVENWHHEWRDEVKRQREREK